MNAIAGHGSVMILPCPDSPTFRDNQAAIKWLEQQGWEIEESVPKNQTLAEQLTECLLTTTNPPDHVQAHIYPHIEAEVRGVLAQVKSLLFQGTPANEIVLVARDDAFYGSLLS